MWRKNLINVIKICLSLLHKTVRKPSVFYELTLRVRIWTCPRWRQSTITTKRIMTINFAHKSYFSLKGNFVTRILTQTYCADLVAFVWRRMNETYTLCTSLLKVSSRKVSEIGIWRMKRLSSKLRYLYPFGEIHHHPSLGLRTVNFSWRLYSTIVLGILSGNLCRIYLQAVLYGRAMVIVTHPIRCYVRLNFWFRTVH